MDRLIVGILCAMWISVPAAAEAPRWEVDYSKSRIEFAAEQAGAEFTGGFDSFTADIRFSPEALDSSTAHVVIPADSVNTQNEERDGYLRGLGWFETGKFPEVVFDTTTIETLGENRFRALGKLTLRDLTVEISFDFHVERTGNQVRLTGTSKLDRFVLGLGLGEWADTKWIGKEVTVNVDLSATVP